jgi:hypothetical protein
MHTTEANLTYFISQENIESYDLRRRLRIFERTSHPGVPEDDKGNIAIASRQSIAAIYQVATHDLQICTILAINEAIHVAIKKHPGKRGDALA